MTLNQETTKLTIAIIGGVGVGKTSIIRRLIGEQIFDLESTQGIGESNYVIKVGSVDIPLSIWDTAGQETFRSLTTVTLKKANAIICVFDVSDKDTVDQALENAQFARDNTNVNIYFVGNKIDLERQVVDPENIDGIYGNVYMETSALTGEGIEQLFTKIAEDWIQSGDHQEIIQLTPAETKTCC